MRREVPLRRNGTARSAGVRYGPGSEAHGSAKRRMGFDGFTESSDLRCSVNDALNAGLCILREIFEKLEQGIEGALKIFKCQGFVVSPSPKLEGERVAFLVQGRKKMRPFSDKDYRRIIRNIVQ